MKERRVDNLLARLLQLYADGRGKYERHTFFGHGLNLLPTVHVLGDVRDNTGMKAEIPIGYVHFALQEDVA